MSIIKAFCECARSFSEQGKYLVKKGRWPSCRNMAPVGGDDFLIIANEVFDKNLEEFNRNGRYDTFMRIK